MKRIIVLGSTGSVGNQTLSVVRSHPDRLRIAALSAHCNAALLAVQRIEFNLPEANAVLGSEKEIEHLCRTVDADLVVVAVAGAVGTRATLAALESGKDVAIATKEVLVAAGGIVMTAAKRLGRNILPIDSEHSAVLQCLNGNFDRSLSRIILTGSGGPFLNWSQEEIASATVQDALNHPTWPGMGNKITVDSATLMNKGLETIEAAWLFGIGLDQIDVAIHPQSIVHSMVQFIDGSLIAQMGSPDMRLPISYALFFPDRTDCGVPHFDPIKFGQPLTFEKPDTTRFPCLELARRAMSQGGTMPAVLNGANEHLVQLFLNTKIGFNSIPSLLEAVMDQHNPVPAETLAVIETADSWARGFAQQLADTTQAKASF